MKKKLLLIIATIIATGMFLTSCSNGNNNYASPIDGVLLVGNKPYKIVRVCLNGNYITTMVPADSSVSVIPITTQYSAGKTNVSVIQVNQ